MLHFIRQEQGGVTGWTVLVTALCLAAAMGFTPGGGTDTTLDRLEDGLGPAVETQVLTG